jgi:hypothetical protein
MEPVRFIVALKKGVDGHGVKPDLEALAADLSVQVHDLQRLRIQLVTGSTTQGTYESVFGAKLAYVTRTIPNLNRGPYKVQEWVEQVPAMVPASLQDRIESIRLDQKMYLTD